MFGVNTETLNMIWKNPKQMKKGGKSFQPTIKWRAALKLS